MRFKLLKNKEKLYKNNREKSRGRSMVEMLGVLAIIGVLSIGGIQGYTIAMRRFRANEISDLITKYAFLVYENFQIKWENNPSSFYPYDFSGSEEWGCLSGAKRFLVTAPESDFHRYFLSLSDAGLGNIPTELSRLYPEAIYIDKETNNVNILMRLNFDQNKELCYQVKNNFSGYNFSDCHDKDFDYTNMVELPSGCQDFSIVIPIEGNGNHKE